MELNRPTATPKKSQEPGPLNFQPLDQGLGFHPFSEGLPYTPTKPQLNRAPAITAPMGAGAVSAGRPVFGPIPSITPVTPKPAQTPAPQISPQPAFAEELASNGFSYLLRRVWAFLFDMSLNFTVVGAGIAAALWRQGVPAEVFLSSGVVLLALAFASFFSWALVTSQEIAFGTSIGKRLFGLTLSGSTPQVLIRAIFFVPMLAIGGLGLVVAVFNRKKACLHDLVSGAQPVDLWNQEL